MIFARLLAGREPFFRTGEDGVFLVGRLAICAAESGVRLYAYHFSPSEACLITDSAPEELCRRLLWAISRRAVSSGAESRAFSRIRRVYIPMDEALELRAFAYLGRLSYEENSLSSAEFLRRRLPRKTFSSSKFGSPEVRRRFFHSKNPLAASLPLREDGSADPRFFLDYGPQKHFNYTHSSVAVMDYEPRDFLLRIQPPCSLSLKRLGELAKERAEGPRPALRLLSEVYGANASQLSRAYGIDYEDVIENLL